MPNITVKNIPDALYRRLKASAETNRRSVNSEIIVCIERAVVSQRINPDEFLRSAQQLRQLTATISITDEAFNHAKTVGRP